MSWKTNNIGCISAGAWSLVVALLPAAVCRADDGTTTDPTANKPSATSTVPAKPTRIKIPPPRDWSKSAPKPAAESVTSESRAITSSLPSGTAASVVRIPAAPSSPSASGVLSVSSPAPVDAAPVESIRAQPEFLQPASVQDQTVPADSPANTIGGGAPTTPASVAAALEILQGPTSTKPTQGNAVEPSQPAPTAAKPTQPIATDAPQPAPLAAKPTQANAAEPSQPAPTAAKPTQPIATDAPQPAPTAAKPTQANLAETLGVSGLTNQDQVDLASMRSKMDDEISQAGCSTCGGYHRMRDGSQLHDAIGCSGGNCIPGRQACNPPMNQCNTVAGAFLQNLYQCLCCPDPCYQPQWVPAANASFFADYARPRTVTRLRYDNLESMTRPDRNQFWISGVSTMGKTGKRPITNPQARLQQFYIYQEAAGEKGSFFIEYPYRQINQNYAPTQAGFSDLNFGIKSLMFDCELLQITFQFRTFTPTGNSMLNLGTGHFALDPSILATLKLTETTYFQGQFGNWIPLAGNQSLAGGVFYSLMSLNQVLCYPTPDSPLIATLEMDTWSFENGGDTASVSKSGSSNIVEKGGGVSYFNIGPGLRQSVCNKLDFGGAITWATSTAHWAQPWFRFEARFLF